MDKRLTLSQRQDIEALMKLPKRQREKLLYIATGMCMQPKTKTPPAQQKPSQKGENI